MYARSVWGLWTVGCLLLGTACGEAPVTRRGEQVDEYHGQQVADPYRWLEDDVRTSEEVAAWVTTQNEHTEKFLDAIGGREAIRRRLTKLWDFEKFGTPFQVAGRVYYEKNDGLQNQYVLYVQETPESEPRVLIDPNTWSEDGTIALDGTSFSEDGRYVAYSIAEAGSDWSVWKVMEIATGKVLDDELQWIKFNSPAWTADGAGFFYARFPAPAEGEAFQELNLNQQVYYHRVGQPQAMDTLVFERPDEPEWGYGCTVTEDGRYLVITVYIGTDERCRVFYRDLFDHYAMPKSLIDNFDNEFSFVGNEGPTFYFLTDLDAPRKRLVALDVRAVNALTAEQRADNSMLPLREIIPQQPEAIESIGLVGNQFIVETLEDAKTRIAMYSLAGKLVRNVDLPGIGSAGGFSGRRVDTETYYSFSSFDTPPSIYRYDLVTGESELFRQAQLDFDPERFEVQQVFYTSKDGTRVPMFLAHKRGLKLDGNNPTLLYGYGGFGVSLSPHFSISKVAWMEMGGIYAMANLRGGGEYGLEWHQGGTKLNKQNVFDDFIAAAEWLIANKYTRTEKLAIQGGSNGGLLVGACLTQRPELYGACIPEVGVMDMLRFHQFTAGRYWVDDYGSADDPEEFKALFAYSPYHNVKAGVCYPPTLVLTADTDDRVVPGHSFKFTAAMQAAQSCDNPVLIRIESRAGHGAGTPTTKIIDEITDIWAFLTESLEMEVPAEW
ncbi:MAG: prolyl oligopeptidase family serine peptidase [Planctomycetaceae bacterium]